MLTLGSGRCSRPKTKTKPAKEKVKYDYSGNCYPARQLCWKWSIAAMLTKPKNAAAGHQSDGFYPPLLTGLLIVTPVLIKNIQTLSRESIR
jgi:hypothetical protein